MPATRTVNGETREWNGSAWVPVSGSTAASSPTPGVSLMHPIDSIGNAFKAAAAVPDVVRGLVAHPADTLSGFFKGAVEGAPEAATIASLALPLVTGGASIPAQMGTTAGLDSIVKALQLAAGDPNAPKSFGEGAADVAGNAALTGVVGGAIKGAAALKSGSGDAANLALSLASHIPGVGGRVAKVAHAIHGLVGGAGGDADAAGASVLPLAENPRLSREIPYKQGNIYTPSASAPDVPEVSAAIRAQQPAGPRLVKGSSLNDELSRVLDGVRGTDTANDAASTISAPVPAGGTMTAAGKPSVSGIAEDGSPRLWTAADANREAYTTDRTTGHFEEAPGGLHDVASGKYGRQTLQEALNSISPDGVHVPDDFSFEAGDKDIPGITVGEQKSSLPEFSYEAGDKDIPGISIGDMGSNPLSRLETASKGLGGSDAAPAADASTSLPRYDRRDEVWGPGSTDTTGNPAQAGAGRANLIYDPQTPTSYLRDQLQNATDPDERAYLAKAIDQRYRIERAVGSMPLAAAR